ncbi:hypothetical protein P43SY_007042 [Pythium insidiosum]|uniref:Uncharacterized protein n=1 Tax=Pythium insidiosum TaxID=114742 RepID=A0AAD5LAF7_PYTIN|nr:hypothetical protein P43SY_007042 [Pythium insidiosum]
MAATPHRRSTVWSSSSRVLDDKWQDAQLESHRARLAQIQGTRRAAKGSARSRPKTRGEACQPLPRAQSSAVKSRQAEIERENLKMIRRIVELQQHGARPPLVARAKDKPKGAAVPPCSRAGPRPSSAPMARSSSSSSSCAYALAVDGVPSAPLPLPASPYGPPHVLYPRAAQAEPPSRGLHSNERQRQHSQSVVASENRKLLQRILSARTSFSRATWEREESQRRQLLHNISRFAYRRRPAAGASTGGASASCTSTLVVVDVDDARRRRTLGLADRDVIRTGSPVTHLRRARPMSASTIGDRTVDDALQRLHLDGGRERERG